MEVGDLFGGWEFVAGPGDLRVERDRRDPIFAVVARRQEALGIVFVRLNIKPRRSRQPQKRQHMTRRSRRNQSFLRIDCCFDREPRHNVRRTRRRNRHPAIKRPFMPASVAVLCEGIRRVGFPKDGRGVGVHRREVEILAEKDCGKKADDTRNHKNNSN